MNHAPAPGHDAIEERKYSMCNKLIIALLVLITAGAVGAQVTGSSEGDTNALQTHPSAAQRAPSAWSDTNMLQPGTVLDQPGSLGLSLTADETLDQGIDRKSTRLNSSHLGISYAVFC